MREFVTDEMIAEMAYGAHASVRFVALGDFFGVRMFVSPPEVADAIYHELDMELLPHVRIVVVGGEVRPLDALDVLPAHARETARALELAGHAVWAFHAARGGAIVALGVDEASPSATRALEVSGLRRVADATCGVRWTLDLDVALPREPASVSRREVHDADVSAALGQLEAILGLVLRRDVDRTVWRGPGVVVTFARAGQHLDGYRLEVALLEPATTIAFSGVSPPGEVVVGGRHPKAGAIAAWMRALVSPQRR